MGKHGSNYDEMYSPPLTEKVIRTTGIQSQFLPGTKIQFAWDSTCLGALKACPRMYQYLYVDGWGHSEESIHLRFGQEFHTAFQEYDLVKAAGASHDDAVRATVKALLVRTVDYAPDPLTKAGKYKSRNILIRSVIWYLDEHRDDPAKTYIKADGKPAVELSFRFELDWGPKSQKIPGYDIQKQTQFENAEHPEYRQPYLLCGHLDRVVDFNGSLFVMDHKTSMTTLGDRYFDQWSPNNQMSLYSYAGKVVLNSPVKGGIINAVQLMLDYDKSGEYGARFVRGFTYRTPDQLSEWLEDLHTLLAQAEAYAEADYWPQNDTACNNYGGCRFRTICSKSPQVREQFLKSDFEKLSEEDRWNPLKPR